MCPVHSALSSTFSTTPKIGLVLIVPVSSLPAVHWESIVWRSPEVFFISVVNIGLTMAYLIL